jgi:hypothetical protein
MVLQNLIEFIKKPQCQQYCGNLDFIINTIVRQ